MALRFWGGNLGTSQTNLNGDKRIVRDIANFASYFYEANPQRSASVDMQGTWLGWRTARTHARTHTI